MTWNELFPKSATAAQRRANWSDFKRSNSDACDWWEDCESHDCSHFKSGWCLLQNLPAGFNPVLSPATGLSGQACMGMGYAPAPAPDVQGD